ncbi:radical SAM family heme chaperone HemW [Bacillus sp. JCM 19034]|uniref:radical SAM family heme chaperone HemW n=1 Tax=Bacillus sp. JCM 19034 TaxID=1481928 RepID=UPI00078468E7|nr:radical SAM family heme chaperone HemW [Bacillus sp. JCM 19034]
MVKAVYIHIPFCEHICYYCDFNKMYLKNQPVDQYIESLLLEMKYSDSSNNQFETIFIGGGTPTALSAQQLKRLLDGMHRELLLDHVKEWTIEVNPDSIDDEKLAVLKEYGVNRLSIGVQSFDSELLKEIGRTHTSSSVYDAVERARTYGFTNISLDLMFGLPKQTPAHFRQSLKEAIELEVEHISAYSLKVEEKTIFFNRQRLGKLTLPPEEAEVSMYNDLRALTEKAGLSQYEISNFAKNGFESKHNLVYWNNEEYAGYGAGAHGYLNGVRYQNHGPLPKYLRAIDQNALPILLEHNVTKVEQIEEQMFLGLRKREGISIAEFQEKFGIALHDCFSEQLHTLQEQGLLIEVGDNVQLTEAGLLLGNEVFEQFIAVLEEELIY